MDLISNLARGFQTAFSLTHMLYCLAGVSIGTLIGVLPGMGPVATVAMLLPATYALEPSGALIMLAGYYYGTQYGDSSTPERRLALPPSAASSPGASRRF